MHKLFSKWYKFFYASAANNGRQRRCVFPSFLWLSVRLLAPISRDVSSLYLVQGFQRNLPHVFITRVGIVEKVFKVKGQGHMCTNV